VSWQRGDRVWYKPTEGISFAGIVLGDGSCMGTVRVLLVGHYFRWRQVRPPRKPRPSFGDGIAPALAEDRLSLRENYISMDAEFSKREETDGDR
jgi:hypothetical protein